MEHLGREGRRANQILVHLRSLDAVCDGGEISELSHALQAASRAERAGADREVVLAALLHDIGKVWGDARHERGRDTDERREVPLRVAPRRSEGSLTHLLEVDAPDGEPGAHANAGSR